MNSVQDILTDLQRSQGHATKTAAYNGAPDLGAARTALQQSLHEVTSGQTKTAQAAQTGGNAVHELTKIASELANADEAATIKQAQLYGAAAFDGFLQRANQYSENAPQGQKFASSDDGMSTKLAADLGYSEAENAIARMSGGNTKTAAQAGMEKRAADAGYIEAEQAIARMSGGNTKTAAEAQMEKQAADAGYHEAEVAIGRLSGGASVKHASDERTRGIIAAAEKVAAASEDCFVRGYNEMHKIAQVLT